MKAFRKVRSEALVSSWQQRVATMTRRSMIASSLTAIATAFVAALPGRTAFASGLGQQSKTPGGGYTCDCPINSLCGRYYSCNPKVCCNLTASCGGVQAKALGCQGVKASVLCRSAGGQQETSCIFNYEYSCQGVFIFCGRKHVISGSHTCACP